MTFCMALEPCVTPIKESRLHGSVTHRDELKETQTIKLHASYLPLCSGIYSPRSPCSALFQRELYSPGSLALWLLGRSANMKDEEQGRSQSVSSPRFLLQGAPRKWLHFQRRLQLPSASLALWGLSSCPPSPLRFQLPPEDPRFWG